MSTQNFSDSIRWGCDLRRQPTNQQPMVGHAIGFTAGSLAFPERVATLEEWLQSLPEYRT